MHKKLLVLPFDTSLSRSNLASLCGPALSAFENAYSGIQIATRATIDNLRSSYCYALDVILQIPTLINGVPGEGVHQHCSVAVRNNRHVRHGIIITDRMISFGGYRAGGTADIANNTALATTLEARKITDSKDLETIIKRTRPVIIHELGHLYGLDHHDAFVDSKFCPMVTRSWDDPEFETADSRATYFDLRGEVFCADCRDKLKALIK